MCSIWWKASNFMMARTFDAQAAKWNFDRILDPEVKSWVRPYYEEIEKVEAVDKYTLRVRMKEPSGALPIALAGYFQGVPMASPKSFETYGKDWVRHPSRHWAVHPERVDSRQARHPGKEPGLL